MTKTIIVIGKSGQLARALISQAESFSCNIISYGRADCDLSASHDVIEAFAQSMPKCDGLIIAAAYTAVDAAEDDKDTAMQVNGAAPAIFAKICHERDIPLVHVSTDYVFLGSAHMPIKADAPTDPINVYGASKLAGEKAIMQTKARAVILRTSWVFDGVGKNFMTTMLRLGQTRESLKVVGDQIGRPTYAGHLARACLTALSALMTDKAAPSGIYHVSGSGPQISWADFAKAIFAKTSDKREHEVKVTPIPTSDYPTPAKRPAYSVLDMTNFEQNFDMKMPDWNDGLDTALQNWRAIHS